MKCLILQFLNLVDLTKHEHNRQEAIEMGRLKSKMGECVEQKRIAK